MVTAYDVPAERLIPKLSTFLKKEKNIQLPEWANYVKTGIHKEKPPEDKDWWFIRTAAILRKIYIKGPIGSSRLQAEFGGFRDRGSRPNKAAKGSGKIIRTILQQLEGAELVKFEEKSGRIVSPKGRSLLDNLSKEIFGDMAAKDPELSKY